MVKYRMEFEAPEDWKPMRESACWVDCPLQCLTRLSEVCRAKEIYDKNGDIMCPIVRFTVNEKR